MNTNKIIFYSHALLILFLPLNMIFRLKIEGSKGRHVKSVRSYYFISKGKKKGFSTVSRKLFFIVIQRSPELHYDQSESTRTVLSIALLVAKVLSV
jgi:hypothetical protein